MNELEILEPFEWALRDFAEAVSEGAFDNGERALRLALALSVMRPALAELVGESER